MLSFSNAADLNVENPILNGAIHEIVHSIRKTDPSSYNKLARIVLEVYNEYSPQWKHTKDLYKNQLKGKSEAYASDYVSKETVCKALGAIMQDSEMLNEFVQKDKNLAKRILKGLHDLIVKVSAWVSGDAKISAEQKKTFSKLEKELRAFEGILYAIGIVAKIDIIRVPQKGEYTYTEEVLNGFKTKYGMVGREPLIIKGVIGEVEIGIKELRAAFRYLNTEKEFSAIFSIPEVVRSGIRVDDDTHLNHKERGYPTYTVAAPVDIGGMICYVGVVLKKTSNLKYKMHRILLPDGKSIELIKRISGYYAEMTAENDGESPAITTDSNGSISQDDPKVKSENTTKKDERFLDLAKDPVKNKAELEKMVEEAAREAGYTF